jgi:predicted HTH domain antitoxin
MQATVDDIILLGCVMLRVAEFSWEANMGINIELPSEIEARLRAELGDVASAGKEAMLVELYREGKISHGDLAEALGLSRYEADGVLKRHGVTEDLLTSEELAEQLSRLRKLMDQ